MDGPGAGDTARRCPWCSATAAADATHCRACGAALAQRESIGDLVIPGVTTVDPALQAYDAQPLRIPHGSPSQGLAGGTILAAAVGGPVGLAALGGLAAVAAAEYVGAGLGGGEHVALEDVGRPSEAVLQALERLEREGGPQGDAARRAAADTLDEGRTQADGGRPSGGDR